MRRDRIRRPALAVVLAAFLAAVAAAPAAAHAGHGGEESRPTNYRSRVIELEPRSDAVRIEITGGDSAVRVVVQPGHTVVVRGYGGRGVEPEPYLRINADGAVQANGNSPAWFMNQDRFARNEVPADARADADPMWLPLSGEGTHEVEWHDHRTHWMAPQPPAAVNAAPGRRHALFDWSLPLTVDGRPVTVHGRLEWLPAVPVWALGLAAAAGAGLVLVLARGLRRDPAVGTVVGAVLTGVAVSGVGASSGLAFASTALLLAGLAGALAAPRANAGRGGFAAAAGLAVAAAATLLLADARMPVRSGALSAWPAATLLALAVGLAVGTGIVALRSRPSEAATESEGSLT